MATAEHGKDHFVDDDHDVMMQKGRPGHHVEFLLCGNFRSSNVLQCIS